MAKQNKRFEIIHQEGNGLSIAYTVFLDTATGVQYLFAQSGYGGGLTPLLDRDGKPMTWEVYPRQLFPTLAAECGSLCGTALFSIFLLSL